MIQKVKPKGRRKSPPSPSEKRALVAAIAALGDIAVFAEAVGAPSEGAVKAWRQKGIPASYCPRIERLTGIPCERLCHGVEWYVLRVSQPDVAKSAQTAES